MANTRALTFLFLLFGSPLFGIAQPELKVPYTYTIDYSPGYVRSATLAQCWKNHPPVMFHGGASIRTLGPTFMGYIETHGKMPQGGKDGPYAEDEKGLNEWRESVRAFNRSLHNAGVKWVIPYYCNQTIFGDASRRTGFWRLYDQWPVFEPLGLGPKPQRDPVSWMQRDPSGRLCFNYEYNVLLIRKQTDSIRRYAPCLTDPDWIEYSKAEARIAAADGFDGLFIDNCIEHSYGPSAQSAFRDWLGRRYTPEQMDELLGFASPGEARLYHEGDIIQWAFTFKEWIPWLETKYPVEERPIYFNTIGPLDATAVNNAGWGMLGGLAEEFIREMVFEGDPTISWEGLRNGNPALAGPQGKLRWAETKRFWADVVGEWLLKVQAAGREINPGFFLVPNWGLMQRIVGAMGRAESGKDVGRMKSGGEIETILFEEGSDLGEAAEGVLSHYNIPLKLSFQNGTRAAMLAYDSGGPDSTALQHAEAAAYGGVCVLHKTHGMGPHHDVQARYQKFFTDHADWYEGFQSAAKTGLLHFWSEVDFDNQRHLEAVYEIHEMLGRWQIPFDHVIEPDLEIGRLARYRVLIAAGVRFLSNSQLEVLHGFVLQGGWLIVVLPFADCDEAARLRTSYPEPFQQALALGRLEWGNGKVIVLGEISQAITDPGIPFEKALQSAQGGDLRKAFPDGKLGEAAFYKELDRRFGLKRYRSWNPILQTMAQAMENPLSVIDPTHGEDIRIALYQRSELKDWVLHLVNYCIPIQGRPSDRQVIIGKEIGITLFLPTDVKRVIVRSASPGYPDEEIGRYEPIEGRLSFTLPVLRDYAVVKVEEE